MKKSEQPLPRLIVTISPAKKQRFKLKCVRNNTTHQDVLENLVDEYIRSK